MYVNELIIRIFWIKIFYNFFFILFYFFLER